MICYHKRKFLRGIDVSRKGGKYLKVRNALDFHRCLTRLKTLKRFLRRYVRKGFKRAVGSLVVRASDSRPEGLGSMPDSKKYPPSTHGVRAR
ncbi:hypothetical protein TNCV_3466991 [Trichonephila clavipes]|nr:hypothetical protein TNCV_3466991 [Trichonephila clavipes]